jgi:hypothetical protein
MKFLSIFSIFACLSYAKAWGCTGHMLIAQIAFNDINESSKPQINELIDNLGQFYLTSPDFVQSACWADDLKSEDVEMYNEWHYINLPYIPTPIKTSTIIPVSSKENAIWVLNKAVQTLKSSKAKLPDKAFMLRMLIHLVGDIHQPMHSINMYGQDYPDGDEGGNLVKVNSSKYKNLHAFWDSGGGLWKDVDRPLTDTNREYINKTSEYIVVSFGHPEKLNYNFEEWTNESYNIAVADAYTIVDGELTPEYINSTRTECQLQIASGGKRLANILNDIFD